MRNNTEDGEERCRIRLRHPWDMWSTEGKVRENPHVRVVGPWAQTGSGKDRVRAGGEGQDGAPALRARERAEDFKRA